jgi:hypothetical protein
MKRFFFIFLFALTALVFMSCSSSDGGGGGSGNNSASCSVSFYDGNGTEYPNLRDTVTCGSEIHLPNDRTREDYAFDGWLPNGTSTVFKDSYKLNSDTVFNAKWISDDPTVIEFIVYFYDSSMIPERTRTVQGGSRITLAPLEKEGFIFNGWRFNGTVYQPNASSSLIIGKTTFAAVWTAKNPGAGEHAAVLYDNKLNYQQTLYFPAGTDIVDSLPSGGWYRAEDTLPINNLTLTEDITLYAIANVHEIRTEEQLNAVRNNLAHNYMLLDSVTLTSLTLDSAKGWTPIGDSGANSFSGIFNGNNHKITGVFIDITSTENSNLYTGLFGYLTGTVKNLGVEMAAAGIKVSFRSGSYVGGIAGYATKVIENCYSKGNISSAGNIFSYVGGIAGYINGTIANSYHIGDITSSTSSSYDISTAGGIAGYLSYGTIENSYSIGDITSSSTSRASYIGGIAGNLYSGTVKNSYSTGKIVSTSTNSDSYAGGIAGENYYSTIENCAAMNVDITSSGAGVRIGRIAGYLPSTFTLANNFANSGMLVNGSVVTTGAADNENGADKELPLFEDQALYETDLGWEFGNDGDAFIWKMLPAGSAYKYPILYWQTEAP